MNDAGAVRLTDRVAGFDQNVDSAVDG